MDPVFKDKRFSHVARDPRFKRLSKEARKVKIDKRFKPMFEDKRFKLKYTVDKRGRPVNTTTSENLRKFYELSDSDDDSSEDVDGDDAEDDDDAENDDGDGESGSDSDSEEEEIKIPPSKVGKGKAIGQKKSINKSDEDSEEDSAVHLASDSEEEDNESDAGNGPDLARGEGNISSSSDEDEEEEEEPEDTVHDWNELDKDTPIVEDATRRLAVCNMDWDRIKAEDLYALMHSFKPRTGFIKSVTIYPSEFGLKRMEEEKVAGPQELKPTTSNSQPEAETIEGSSYHREKLRQYQLNRLKYYYAVVELDSKETAENIYKECDGIEYESSSTRLDLRFIPDDMSFDQKATSTCNKMPDSSIYAPSQFYTTALGQSKVDLTWDETDRERVAKLNSNVKVTKGEIEEADFQAYLASSSDEEEQKKDIAADEEGGSEEEEGSRLEKYKKLILELEGNKEKAEKKDTQMEVTWEPGLRETTEEIVKKKQKAKDMTVWDEYLQKKAEKKRKKREDKKIQPSKTEHEDEEDVAAFSDDDVPAGVDIDDPFFAEEMKANQKQAVTKTKKKKGKRGEKLTADELKAQEKEKAQLALLMEDDDRQHYNLKDLLVEAKKKKRKKKRKREEPIQIEDSFKIDTADPRFSEIYKSSLFHIDPSAPEFKRTKAMESVIAEKMRRVGDNEKSEKTFGKKSSATIEFDLSNRDSISTNSDSVKKKHNKQKKNESKNSEKNEHREKGRTLDPSLASLVKSVKAKTHQFKNKHKS